MIAPQPNPRDPLALEKELLLRAFHETGIELSEALEELTEKMVEAHARKAPQDPLDREPGSDALPLPTNSKDGARVQEETRTIACEDSPRAREESNEAKSS